MALFKRVFDILNGVESKKDLDKIGFKLVDFEYSKILFYELQKSYNQNRGKKATAKTLIKPVAHFYGLYGFNVTEKNGVFIVSYTA